MSNENEEVVEAESTEVTQDDTPIVSNKLKAIDKLDEQEMLAVEAAIMTNNFQGLSVSQRMAIVAKRCEKLGVDPTQGPFVWGKGDGGRLMLIATKNLSQQLRANRDLRCEITEEWKMDLGLILVRCTVSIPNGRSDQDIGVVSIKAKQGEGLANAIMGAYTKAKNRATLSLCGVGGLDESEMAAIRSEQRQKLFEAEPQGMRRVEPGPSQMNQGLLGQGTGDHVPGGVPIGAAGAAAILAGPRVSKSGMPYAKDLVKAGQGGALEEEEQIPLSGDGEGKQPLKPTPLPVQAPPPPGRVITARPPGLVKAGQPNPALVKPPQQASNAAPPPAPRPPKASPVRAGGK